jgi:tetratricopeptide (TPR) repeat protein
MAQLAYEEAARLYEMALKAFSAAGVTDAPLHCELLLALGDAQSRTGEGSSAAEAFREAASIAKEQRDGECLARAALGYGGLRRSAGFVDEPLIQLLNEALDALPDEDSALRARVLARLAVARYHAASHESIQSQSQQAVAMARRLDDKETLVYVLETAHFYLTDQLDSAARIAAAGELIPLAESIGHREIALRARRAKIIDLLGLGRVQEADAELATFARLAEEARHTTLRWDAAVCFAMRALLDGRYSEAEGLIDRALALGRDAQGQTYLAFLFYQIQLFRLRRAQGRLAELEDGTRTFVQRYGVIPARAALGILEMELDRAGAARDEFERMAAQDFADLAEDYNLPAALTQLAELCAFVGDARRAAILYERLLPWEHQVATMGATADSNGAVARYLGLLASTMERWNDAERHFRAAIALHQRMGARPFLMHTLRDYAAMLEKRNAPGDLTEAERLLKEADAIARDLDVRVAVAQ